VQGRGGARVRKGKKGWKGGGNEGKDKGRERRGKGR